MNPTEMTEDEFLCAGNILKKPDNALAASATATGVTILEEANRKSFSEYPVLRACGSYKIIRLGTTDTGLIDAQCNLVGYYIGEGLEIDPDHRGQSLSVPLILEALPHRPRPTSRKVSRAGEAALRKAWRVANGREECEWVTKT